MDRSNINHSVELEWEKKSMIRSPVQEALTFLSENQPGAQRVELIQSVQYACFCYFFCPQTCISVLMSWNIMDFQHMFCGMKKIRQLSMKTIVLCMPTLPPNWYRAMVPISALFQE